MRSVVFANFGAREVEGMKRNEKCERLKQKEKRRPRMERRVDVRYLGMDFRG